MMDPQEDARIQAIFDREVRPAFDKYVKAIKNATPNRKDQAELAKNSVIGIAAVAYEFYKGVNAISMTRVQFFKILFDSIVENSQQYERQKSVLDNLIRRKPRG